MENITFFILRHVNSELTNKYWIHCYNSIRKFYDNKIIIIDDNSNQDFLNNEINLKNTLIINSEFKGAGELLPYYYFYKLKPSNKMIFLHDSMFLIKKFDENRINNILDVNFLFYFDFHSLDKNPSIRTKLKKLNHYKNLLLINKNKDLWYGCFGVSSIITLKFITIIQEKYNLFYLLNFVNSRKHRMDIERIFGIICYDLLKENKYYFCDIHHLPNNFILKYEDLDEYFKNKKNEFYYEERGINVIKYWSGR